MLLSHRVKIVIILGVVSIIVSGSLFVLRKRTENSLQPPIVEKVEILETLTSAVAQLNIWETSIISESDSPRYLEVGARLNEELTSDHQWDFIGVIRTKSLSTGDELDLPATIQVMVANSDFTDLVLRVDGDIAEIVSVMEGSSDLPGLYTVSRIMVEQYIFILVEAGWSFESLVSTQSLLYAVLTDGGNNSILLFFDGVQLTRAGSV